MGRPEGAGGEDDRKAPAPGKHFELIAFADRAYAGGPRPDRRHHFASAGEGKMPPADPGGVGPPNESTDCIDGFEPGAKSRNYRILRPLFCACA
jgi:hypothetical protein